MDKPKTSDTRHEENDNGILRNKTGENIRHWFGEAFEQASNRKRAAQYQNIRTKHELNHNSNFTFFIFSGRMICLYLYFANRMKKRILVVSMLWMVILGFTVCTFMIYEVQTSINLVEETKEVDDDVKTEDGDFSFNEDLIDGEVEIYSVYFKNRIISFFKPFEDIEKGYHLPLIKPPLN